MTQVSARYVPERFHREYIDGTGALQAAVQHFSEVDAVGVDVEMGQRLLRRPGGAQEWKHVLALIQIAGDDLSVVVDPLRCDDLTPLQPLMAGPVRKIFLGGGQDAALLEDAGLPARNIADVGEVAYSVFGRREDGMAALSHRIFGLNLDKTIRRTDWLTRPLNPSLIAYAHQDAELTLLIYRWFQVHYPGELALHERRDLEPPVPSDVPDWLRDAILRSSTDPSIVVNEHTLDPTRDAGLLAEDIRSALAHFSHAPRRINRLVRIAGELGLQSVLELVVPLADSSSSLLRASAARALGKLGNPEDVLPILERLAKDPIEDVRKAADAGLRDLRSGKKRGATETARSHEEAEEAGLGGDALAALQRLKQQLGEDE